MGHVASYPRSKESEQEMPSTKKQAQEKKEPYHTETQNDHETEKAHDNNDVQDMKIRGSEEAEKRAELFRMKLAQRQAESSSCSDRVDLYRDERRHGAGCAPNMRTRTKPSRFQSLYKRLSNVTGVRKQHVEPKSSVRPVKPSLAARKAGQASRRQQGEADRLEAEGGLDKALSDKWMSRKRLRSSSLVDEPASKKARTSPAKLTVEQEATKLAPANTTLVPESIAPNKALEEVQAPANRKRKASAALDVDYPASSRKVAKLDHSNRLKRKASVSIDVCSVFCPRKRQKFEHIGDTSTILFGTEQVKEPATAASTGQEKTETVSASELEPGQAGPNADERTEHVSPRSADLKDDSEPKEDTQAVAEEVTKMPKEDVDSADNHTGPSAQDSEAQTSGLDSALDAELFGEEPGPEPALEPINLAANDEDEDLEMQAALLASIRNQRPCTEESAPEKTKADDATCDDTTSQNMPEAVLRHLNEGDLPDSWRPRGLENPWFACFQNAVLQCLHALPMCRTLLRRQDDQFIERNLDNNLTDEDLDLCAWEHKLNRPTKSDRDRIKRCKAKLKSHLQRRANIGELRVSRHLAHVFNEMSEARKEPIDKYLLQQVCGKALDEYDASESFNGESQQDAADFFRSLLFRLDSENAQESVAQLFDMNVTTRRACRKCRSEKAFHETNSVLDAAYQQNMQLDSITTSLFPRARDEGKYAEVSCDHCATKGAYEDIPRWERARAISPSRYLLVRVAREENQELEPTLDNINIPAIENGQFCTVEYALRAATLFESDCKEAKGGHYTAVRKHGDKWFWCDDAKVSQLSERRLSQELRLGQIFFYERVDDQ